MIDLKKVLRFLIEGMLFNVLIVKVLLGRNIFELRVIVLMIVILRWEVIYIFRILMCFCYVRFIWFYWFKFISILIFRCILFVVIIRFFFEIYRMKCCLMFLYDRNVFLYFLGFIFNLIVKWFLGKISLFI